MPPSRPQLFLITDYLPLREFFYQFIENTHEMEDKPKAALYITWFCAVLLFTVPVCIRATGLLVPAGARLLRQRLLIVS
jgi:hypothetical protein